MVAVTVVLMVAMMVVVMEAAVMMLVMMMVPRSMVTTVLVDSPPTAARPLGRPAISAAANGPICSTWPWQLHQPRCPRVFCGKPASEHNSQPKIL